MPVPFVNLIEAEDTAANVVRCAKAIDEEAPLLLECVRHISTLNLPKAEARLHPLIRDWGLSIPLDLYLYNKGLTFVPLILPSQWMEYILCNKPSIALGGFARDHPARAQLLQSFWSAFRHEEPDHAVFSERPQELSNCVPYMLYSDEGRGLRKAPLMLIAMETVLSTASYTKFEKLRVPREKWCSELFQDIQMHTGHLSSYLSRILVGVIPHNLYKGKRNTLYHDVMKLIAEDMASIFRNGIQVEGERFYPTFIACKGDAPALVKIFRLQRSFQHWSGTKGICAFCHAGQATHEWEDLSEQATWRSTLHATRPWSATAPSCLANVPFSDRPERAIRNDLLHLVKLGVSRHFVASAIVCLGEWGAFAGSPAGGSVEGMLNAAYNDFLYCCKSEVRQTANLKNFTKDLMHWPRRSSFPFGGLLELKIARCFLLL